MRILILSCLLGALALPLSGQNEAALKAIRAHYYSLNAKIDQCNEEPAKEPCELYIDEVVQNSKNAPWPVVGIYSRTITYYYDRSPEFAKMQHDDELYGLQKIVVQLTSSAREEYAEYLLQKGQVVFKFTKEYWEGDLYESRMYFDQGLLFKYNVNGEDRPDEMHEVSMESLHLEFLEYADIFRALHP
ncbi:MAG: hypothetical protein KDC44_10545 [Phaeodactylibacter sp.]|nr:hypothetical protein [Phaeodactylibacter sp.]